MYKLISFLVTMVMSLSLHAHEGHDHGPSMIAPPKGGVIRSLETIHLELLPQGKTVKIFVYDKKMEPVEAKKYPVSAMATRPRKQAEAVELKTKKSHWEFEYDAKGSHRYTLQLSIEQGGHKDKVQWNIEPRR